MNYVISSTQVNGERAFKEHSFVASHLGPSLQLQCRGLLH